ncbi:MAG: CatB-related O-acetyltransferase [bacterium]|nr:CatB-related O-acetyltransferase [bacterium]
MSPKPDIRGVLNKKYHLRKYDIGDYSYGFLKVLHDGGKASLKIGKFCSFAPGSAIGLGAEHRHDWVTTYHSFDVFMQQVAMKDYSVAKGNVVVGNDVWFGDDAFVMSGVEIGNGAVIGARSVVRRSIPPYAIVMGNPGRPIGYRFDKEIIEKLEKIAWWDWPLEKIKKAHPLLHSERVEEFIEKYLEE